MRAKTKYRTVGVKGQGGVTRGFAYYILQHRNQMVVFEVICFVSLSPHGLAYCCACFAPRFASCSVLSALRLLRSEKLISAELPGVRVKRIAYFVNRGFGRVRGRG